MEICLVKRREYKELEELYNAFKVSKNGKVCIAVGGDGTFIRAARAFNRPILPIYGNDKLSTGFYSDLNLSDIKMAAEKLKKGDYIVEEISKKIEIKFKSKRYYAINEALLRNISEEIAFSVYENENGKRRQLYPFVMSGDGLLVSSAVGSTAYNRAAGGPIILDKDIICMTFINIDGPYSNPIVAKSSAHFEVEIVKNSGVLSADGNKIATLHKGDHFSVSASSLPVRVVRFEGKRETFSEKLEKIIRRRMSKR
ncbi:MAG: NAD(+)/NADH kinase [Candidatus Micrarchaeia archaeon]